MRHAKNILFLMADEHQTGAISALGHPVVKTPNLDRLVERGTTFTNAYTPSPICVPARAALATGRYVHQTGYWDNAHAYDGRLRSWGHVLQDAGLTTTSIGKLHYTGVGADAGFQVQLHPLHIQGGIGQVWGSVRDPLPHQERGAGMLGAIGAGCSAYNRFDMEVAETAASWLQEPARKDGPWAAFVSFVAPHFPLTVPHAYLDLYPADDMPLPALHPETGYDLHPWVARMNDIENSDSELGSDDARRDAIAAYYALCTFVDAQIGKVLEALEASGQAEDTLILYASDHGETLGMRGRWGKSVLYSEATQVPLIAVGPGFEAGTQAQTAVSLLDIPPTMTAAIGASADLAWVGQDLAPIACAGHDRSRLVFSEYHAVNSASGGFMVASSDWAYHSYVGYQDELFDLAADPLQQTNLASDPSHASQLSFMKDALHRLCDPIAVDKAAKADQNKLVARFGGPEVAYQTGPAGATPIG